MVARWGSFCLWLVGGKKADTEKFKENCESRFGVGNLLGCLLMPCVYTSRGDITKYNAETPFGTVKNKALNRLSPIIPRAQRPRSYPNSYQIHGTGRHGQIKAS